MADFFVEQVPGGGELCSEEIIKFFRSQGIKVDKVQSHNVTGKLLEDNRSETIMVSNFMNLSEVNKQLLSLGRFNYCIIEHDHKYNRSRNPLSYPGMIVPDKDLMNLRFFEGALAVFCQSKAHAEVVQKNIWTDNVLNLGCNLWSDEDLAELEKRLDRPKTRKYGIMDSNNPIKGTKEAVELCRSKNIDFDLIPPAAQGKFWDDLSKTESIVFLPQTYETYSRFAIEAKILGCKMITNKAIGAMSEPYYELNGKELLDTVKNKKQEVLNAIREVAIDHKKPAFITKPKVSLITTVYKGEEYMEGFLESFVEQKNCNNHELIIVDANSPEREQEIVKKYQENHKNIKYIRLGEKKTTMECFNIATDEATGEFIGLCMVDDRLAPNHLDTLSKELKNYSVDLVYGDVFVTNKPNEKFDKNTSNGNVFEHSKNKFSKEGMIKNLPGPVPMYKRDLHYRIGGYRNEILHGGDWEFYLRAVKNGSVFRKLDKAVGLYYDNPRRSEHDRGSSYRKRASLSRTKNL